MNHIHFESIDSTSSYAKKYGSTFLPDQITCITAEEQTAGRGRFNRPWTSPKGVNLYATFYFKLPLNTKHLTCLAQIMTASIAAVLQEMGLNPTIKWPNDVRLSEKKVCGVLCEIVFQQDAIAAILGVGLNINMDSRDLNQIDQPATSLKAEMGLTQDKTLLLKKVQTQFVQDVEIFKQKGFAPFRTFIEPLLSREQVSWFDGKKSWVGTYHSLNCDGGLNISLPDGTLQTIYT